MENVKITDELLNKKVPTCIKKNVMKVIKEISSGKKTGDKIQIKED